MIRDDRDHAREHFADCGEERAYDQGVMLGERHAADDPRRQGLPADLSPERNEPLEVERDARAASFGPPGSVGRAAFQSGYDNGYERAIGPAGRWAAILACDIAELELGVRAYNVLKRRGIDTCGQVLDLDLAEAAGWDSDNPLRRLGRAGLAQLREAQVGLQSIQLQLGVELLEHETGRSE